METLRERLREQKGRHQGGSKWIGTAGTSPFGAEGYNPEGIRIGQEKNRNNRAVKVWDKREFRDLDGNVELGIRNIKIALRRLRKFARTGAPDELDLDTTIKETAKPRLSRCAYAPRAAQCRQGAGVLRYRRLHGLACRAGRGIVFRRQEPNSSTWNISISTIASMRACGSRTTADALPTARRPGTCCINIRMTIKWCSSAMLRCRPMRS